MEIASLIAGLGAVALYLLCFQLKVSIIVALVRYSKAEKNKKQTKVESFA